MELKFALFALPGPGDAILAEGPSPEILISHPDDFASYPGRKISSSDPTLVERLREAKIDLVIVAGWEERIPESVYSWTRFGGWNIHPSLLPRYRGQNPYFHVLANGERETGITVHRMTNEFDAGPILLSRRVAIATHETIGSLWHKLCLEGAHALQQALEMIRDGARVSDQEPGNHPCAPRVKADDLFLRSTFTVERALNLIRAANPFYGAPYILDGEILKVYEARAAREGDEHLVMECADGKIAFTIVSAERFGIVSAERYREVTREFLKDR